MPEKKLLQHKYSVCAGKIEFVKEPQVDSKCPRKACVAVGLPSEPGTPWDCPQTLQGLELTSLPFLKYNGQSGLVSDFYHCGKLCGCLPEKSNISAFILTSIKSLGLVREPGMGGRKGVVWKH